MTPNDIHHKFQRLLFSNINKYQQQILIPVLILCLFACAGTIYAIKYVSYIDQNVAVLCNFDSQSLVKDVPWFVRMHLFNKIVPWLFFGMMIFLLAIIMWLYYVSNKLLGPINRILGELDKILSGERTEILGTRPGDEVFEELLKRINQLIKKNR